MKTVFGYWRRDPLRWALELEAVAEDQVVTLGGVGPEASSCSPGVRASTWLTATRGSPGSARDPVGAGVPRGIGDGPGVTRPTRNPAAGWLTAQPHS